MLALLYLALLSVLGDAVCRRYLPLVSTPHRLASAFLTGLLFSSWITYLGGLLFSGTSSPLFWGNIVYVIIAVGMIVWLRRSKPEDGSEPPDFKFETADAAFIIAFAIMATWLMVSTLTSSDGMLRIGYHEFFDFGQTLSIQQSFALGANFPAENPHYAGEAIKSYFLFYFQAGNLEYLGLDPAWSNNLLSILSMVAMLMLVMTLGRVLFDSKWAGRIGAALFFFHGSLSFWPFLRSQASFGALIDKLSTTTTFFNSGLPLKGEDWGVWTQNVFVTQRNLTSSIGLLLLVLIFVIARLRDRAAAPDENGDDGEAKRKKKGKNNEEPSPVASFPGLSSYVFCGIVLGLMAMWNGAILLPGLILLGILLIVFQLRREMAVMLAIALTLAIPQLFYLQSGAQPATFSYVHWAYLFENPSVYMVFYFLLFTFGFKWLLIAVGLKFTGRFQRTLFAVVSVLLVMTFTTRFTEELLANHKYINIWLVIANVYVGYCLVRIWQMELWKSLVPVRAAVVALVILITLTGIFDLMPIRNSKFIDLKYEGEPLVEWIKANTDPKAVFLTHRYSNHQILLAGRRIFFGEQYYGWESRVNTSAREAIYKQMLESTDPNLVLKLLKDNNIKYLAIDDSVRRRGGAPASNEDVYARACKLVFTDTENRYGNLKVYMVP